MVDPCTCACASACFNRLSSWWSNLTSGNGGGIQVTCNDIYTNCCVKCNCFSSNTVNIQAGGNVENFQNVEICESQPRPIQRSYSGDDAKPCSDETREKTKLIGQGLTFVSPRVSDPHTSDV